MRNEGLSEQSRDKMKQELYQRFSRRGLRRQQRRRRRTSLALPLSLLALSGGKRGFDLLGAATLLALLFPVLFPAWLLTGARLRRTPRVGRYCETYEELSFNVAETSLAARLRLTRLPVLINILRGEMSFVGPRAVSPGDLSPRERAARKRYNVRPGLICLWWVRQRANIAFNSEAEVDAEYVNTQSLWGDLGLLARALPAVLYGEGLPNVADLVRILGIRIHNLTMSETIDHLLARMDGAECGQVCFVNADCANISFRDAEYRDVLNGAALTLADGIGLKLAGKLLGREIKQNVNGTDLFPRLCGALEGTSHGIYLLGAKPGVAEAVRGWIEQHHPGTRVAGVRNGYFTPEEEPAVIQAIADSGASLLLVAFGAPKQDKWIARHLPATGVRVAMGVGGLFDFYSGNIPRAPQWLREIGGEWLYRFWQEPRRMWKRYFVGNVVFLYRVLRERRSRPDESC